MPWPKGKPSWNAGKTKDNDDRVKKYSETLSINLKGKRPPLTEEGRISLSKKSRENILARYASGWESSPGRCKRIQYDSPIAGQVWLHGSWELKVAVWLDTNNFKWKRNKDRFQYTNLKGGVSFYTPDFFVEELAGYLEVKGYETELDRCKWSQMSKKLTIWKKIDLIEKGIL
jgi:hypothetical protein